MTNDDQTNQSATSPTNGEAVRSGDWLGEAPRLTPDSKGWWWLWSAGEWCAASLIYAEYFGGGPAMRVKWMNSKGAASSDVLTAYELTVRVWGGRLAVPGASPSEEFTEQEGAKKA